MGRLDVGDKAERVLRFMFGLVNPRILALLAGRGFTRLDYEEGWQLLRATGKIAFDELAPAAASDPTVLGELDTWENLWFPIADATLSRRHPAVRERLFLNLTQTEGLAVVLSVGTFIDRLDAMAAGDAAFGPDAKAARQVLEARGLTDAALGVARALILKVGPREVPPPVPVPVPPPAAEDRDKAEADMWAWYLEWSEIARRTVTSRRELRELGFLSPGRRGTRSDPDASDPDPSAPPGPAVPAAG
ncbi:MAG: hypothetical protein IT373_05260 [Polyangiaceae bacterium]|nr:hypothetical protein [Polyangiaceae bacterium]